MDQDELKQAVRTMLFAELEAMHFYQQATRLMRDEGAIYHFNLMAQEELEHARTFHSVYPGDDLPELEELLRNFTDKEISQHILDGQLLSRLTEKNALELAIKLESAVIENLEKMLKQVRNPAARAVIENNIDSTRGHLEIIQQDVQRLYTDDVPTT